MQGQKSHDPGEEINQLKVGRNLVEDVLHAHVLNLLTPLSIKERIKYVVGSE